MSFREIRLHTNKPPQYFLCDLLHHEETHVVLRYITPDAYTVGACTIAKGSVTIAYYWSQRNYILWIFKNPHASLIGYLFHIVRDVEIGADYVRYLDLELDIWFSPAGIPTVLDEDEVKGYYKQGIFDDRTISLIERQQMEILNNFRSIISTIRFAEEPA